MPVLAAAVPAAIGLYQAISGGIKAKKAQRALEQQKITSYAPSKEISDYYQTALNRYNVGPYNTTMFGVAKQGAGTAYATGINALKDRRAAIGNVGALGQQYSNNLLRAASVAEGRQDQNFRTVGSAAQAKAGEERYGYGVNAMFPYQQNRQLYGLQASGGVQEENAGLSNIGSALNNAGILAYRQKYGGYGGYGQY